MNYSLAAKGKKRYTTNKVTLPCSVGGMVNVATQDADIS